ncbi:MAG TPA: MGMT family protein [Chitinophagales bacterium]|nr:MGMT family protein [Chitinophagales bacterium]
MIKKAKKKKSVAGVRKNAAVAKKAAVKATQTPENKSYTFFQNVYEVARLIPRGRVTSYGAIAKYLGSGRSARLVGYAMNDAGRQVPHVPAHRVLNRNGLLTGKHHFNPPGLMQKLLEKEGIKVKKDAVIDFKTVFWDPLQELSL